MHICSSSGYLRNDMGQFNNMDNLYENLVKSFSQCTTPKYMQLMQSRSRYSPTSYCKILCRPDICASCRFASWCCAAELGAHCENICLVSKYCLLSFPCPKLRNSHLIDSKNAPFQSEVCYHTKSCAKKRHNWPSEMNEKCFKLLCGSSRCTLERW